MFSHNLRDSHCTAHAILECGSQRTYVTKSLRDQLDLPREGTESLQIETFGAPETSDTRHEIVRLDICVENGEILTFHALGLTDSAWASDTLCIDDILIGSDSYWNFVTGQVVRGDRGLTAIYTKMGWVLSGQMENFGVAMNLTAVSAHILVIGTTRSTLESYLN